MNQKAKKECCDCNRGVIWVSDEKSNLRPLGWKPDGSGFHPEPCRCECHGSLIPGFYKARSAKMELKDE